MSESEKSKPAVRWDRDSAIVSHMNLVRKIAGGFNGRGIAVDDLCSIGYLSLTRAADSFEPERGSRFSTLATIAVTRAMISATRGERKRQDDVSIEANEIEVMDDPWTDREAEENAEAVRAAVAALPDDERTLVLLDFGIGVEVPVGGVNRHLGIGSKVAWQRRKTARSRLRIALDPDSAEPAESADVRQAG